jgi:predicted enzyme related to lactoylglutathione lyase
MSEQPNPAYGPGSFVWQELCTRDVKQSQDFYGKVFGWKFEPWGPPGAYWMIKAGDNGVGGMMDVSNPEVGQMPPCWAYYIDTDNVDKTSGRVEGLGGKVLVPPTDIPEVGRFSAIQDPAGAMVNIMTLNEHSTEPPQLTPGTFLWRELMSRDLPKAVKFYSELVGWKADEMEMPDGAYTLFSSKNGQACGGMPVPPEMPAEVPSNWIGYIFVPEVDSTIKKVEENGGQVLFPPMQVPNVGRFTQISDPNGTMVAIMTPEMPS